MNITTIRTTRRLGLASSAAAALLFLASACGTETAATQAPASIRGPQGSSTETESPADLEECLVQQAKNSTPAPPAPRQTDRPRSLQPLFLAPSGRPVPLPGQHG